MNFISIGGLLTLLGIAWLMSYHRQDLKLRPIFWGLSLQFLFALIILRKDEYSNLGMLIFSGLLIAYLTRSSFKHKEDLPLAGAGVLFAGLLGYLAAMEPFDLSVWWILPAFIFLLAMKYAVTSPLLQPGAFLLLGTTFALYFKDISGQEIFQSLSDGIAGFLSLSDYGAQFLFGNLVDGKYFFTGTDSAWPGFGFQFAFKVLPTIIFFGGFMSVLYYLGIMQKAITAMSRFMRWTIGTSGAETLSCSANIFVGQTEAPLLIKPFLNSMTQSELLTIMVGGFATIAGGVLAGYIAMGIPAGHLVAASVMSAPAALVIGKLIFPEREHSQTAGDVELPDIKVGRNVIEAAANGITDGLKLAVNVGAMLIGFIALVAVIDVLLNALDAIIDGGLLGGDYSAYGVSSLSPIAGEYIGWFPGSLKTLFGNLLQPLAWLMGVPWDQADEVGNLLGIKLSLNEFVAYGTLGDYIQSGVLSERAIIISTYALCGFSNFSSIGIQIGGISAIAPSRRSDLAKIGLKAMFGGAIASWLTATIAGIII